MIMAEARSTCAWNHTSSILAAIANAFRDPKRSPVQPDDIHPHMRKRKKKFAGKVGVRALKHVFIDQYRR